MLKKRQCMIRIGQIFLWEHISFIICHSAKHMSLNVTDVHIWFISDVSENLHYLAVMQIGTPKLGILSD